MGTFHHQLDTRMFVKKMRLLAVVTLTVSTVLIIAAIVILCLAFKSSSDRCDSNECKVITSALNKSMDLTVEPCDDLYKFTCGKWSENNLMTEFISQNSVEEQAVEGVHFKLNAQLRYPEYYDSTSPIDFIKHAYEECIRIKESVTDSEQLKALVDNLSKEGQDEIGLLMKLLSLGESIIFNIKIAADPFNPSKYVIWLTPPRFNIDPHHLRNSRTNSQSKLAVDLYRKSLQLQSRTVLRDPTSVSDAINLEIALASTPALIQDSPDSNDRIMKMDFAKLQKALPSSSSLNYLDIVNRVAMSVGSKTRVTVDSEVVVENLNYFKEIADIIQQLQPGVLQSYLILRIIQSYGFALDSEFIAIDQNYMSKGRSNMYNFNQTSRCLDFFVDTYPDLMGKVHSQQVKLSKEQIEDVEMIVRDVQTSFKKTIDKSTWLTSSSKSILKDKLDSINVKIGFPRWIQQDETNDWVDRFVFDTQATAGDSTKYYTYVRMIYLRERARKRAFDWLMRPSICQDNWLTSPASLKVKYDHVQQSLEIPAAVIAEGVYYSHRWPNFLKYARLGTLLAHHMTHALDRTGVNFNSQGRMEKLLPNDMENELKKQMLCYVDKYRDLSDGQISDATARKSLDENYADCESIKVSFDAFGSNVGRVVKLPDRSFDRFSRNQLFILSYVSLFCGEATADARMNQLFSQFLPLEFRAVYPIANSQELSSQFSCPANSKLNTNNKCRVW